MGYIDNREFKGVLIAVTGYVLLSTAVNHILGAFFIKWPWFLIPLALSMFIASKYFTDRVPFLSGNGYIGQVFQILVVIISYSIFIKSLMAYVEPTLQQYAYGLLALGFIMMIYATKHHLVGASDVSR